MKSKAPSTLDTLAVVSHSTAEYPISEMAERLSDYPLAIVQMPHAPPRSALK
ncbi:hypothetical protein BJ917_0351 [Pseudomonas sp. WPR_5_2]|nr:hypothetical protein BJ917_0351 [Pseudomonas sp. WPR_5_2]